MKYWPTTAVLSCPFLTSAQRAEVVRMNNDHVPLSVPTMQACHACVRQIPATTSMVIVHSEGADCVRVFLRHPNEWEWNTLERSGFVDGSGQSFGFTKDRLH